ncbi:protein NEN1-like [Rutidosis leptorrhynchoides]|uniref:protein NEN1-like n=1 Tax=Rutidosis leptorrhynchoides TaxID=125765 RepID=UPI003A9938B5
MGSGVDRSEIVFFDLETTIPNRIDQSYAILEFGSILVCPQKLNELDSYETLVKPHDVNLITDKSILCNGITPADVDSAPYFTEIADRVYNILHGRVWAGHNILRFDCVRLREAYARINRPPPQPKGTIDTLVLLTQSFGRRAINMKMESLAAYFGLGKQSHRSLGDVRMNLEVVKRCAAVLFLESSQRDIYNETNRVSPNVTTGFRCNGKTSLEGTGSNTSPFSYNRNLENPTFPPTPIAEENKHPNTVDSAIAQPNPSHVGPYNIDKMETESPQSNEAMVEESSTTTLSNAFTNHSDFILPDDVSMASITVTIAPFVHGSHRIQILHRDIPLQIRCDGMRIRFGLSTQFVDHVGRPRLSFVVDANNENLCGVLDAYDSIAKRFMDSDSNSEWRPVVCRKPGFYNSPTIRLHLPTVAEDTTRLITEIYVKESPSSSVLSFVSSSYDVAELESLIGPGLLVDAYLSLDPYNYQQNAGIRLVAKKLIVHR